MNISADVPTPVLIRDGHRGLLNTFREFALETDVAGQPLDTDVVRAAVAFLREGLRPFAHWEEQHAHGCEEVAEDTAFEHAFLNAEVEALAGALADLERRSSWNRAELERRVRKHLHRIESVLELHVEKAEDRERPQPSVDRRPERSRGATREMTADEVTRFLGAHEWGVLATVGDGQPYAVPVSYGYDGRSLYIASGPGKKRRNLETSSVMCLTVADVKDGDHWRSVVVTGRAELVGDVRGKLHGLNSIRRNQASDAPPSPGDLLRAARATVFRVAFPEISGRIRG